MDTRAKIISEQEAHRRLAGEPAQWVAGSFDPLLAEHVRMLRQYAAPNRRLVVEITNPPRPLLPARARAELVAALGLVDYVVLGNGAAKLQEPEDSGITGRFVQRVLERHRREGPG